MLDERPAAPATRPAPEVVVRVDTPRRRRLPGLAGIVSLVLIAAVIGAGVLLWNRGFGLGALFGTRTVDRSAPVIVEKLQDRSEYRGASGTFSATVDVETKHGILPTFLAGGRTIYNGVGEVDATVGFRAVSAVASDADGSLTITLPHARLSRAHLDPTLSHVMSRNRGLADRIGGTFVDSPTSDREVERIAERRIERAAVRSELRARAERNTSRMIRDLAAAFGVDDVRVVFSDHPVTAGTD